MNDFKISPSIRMDDEEAETNQQMQQSVQVDKHLFESRTVFVAGPITMAMAKDVCTRLMALAQDSSKPITVIVSSPGGHVESGDMIHDMIKFIKPKVNVLGMGWVASAGALIYVSVPKSQRFCTPNTRFLLHQPSGGAGGQATDIEIQANEMIRMRERLNSIFAAATGQSMDRIEKDTDRDYWMGSKEAVKYGLVGKIVEAATEIK